MCYVLMRKEGQYWDGLKWTTDLQEAEHYVSEEDSDSDAIDILQEQSVSAAAVEIDDDDEE